MSPRAAITAVGAVTVAGEAALAAAVFASGGPDRIGLYLAVCAVATAAMIAALHKLLGLPPRDSGGGGGDGAPPDEPPPWWPEFEREFRAHVQARDARPPVGGR
jgi:hypothetical protein